MSLDPNDPITLSQALIRCKSITPAHGGALDLLEEILGNLGFRCSRLTFQEPNTDPVDNLYARWGVTSPNFCFAGHVDVVPVGDLGSWNHEPFSGIINNGYLYGRGASDMKSAIASFVTAASQYIERNKKNHSGSISLLITSDEEGPAINGTKKIVEWLKEKNETIDVCLVGEPTNPNLLGEMIKIGRRGSLTGCLKISGQQGHVAYPDLAENPIPQLIDILKKFSNKIFDKGNKYFQPSNLEITTIDVGNNVSNIIPNHATAQFNIRFNNEQTSESLVNWLHKTCKSITENYELQINVTGEAFLNQPSELTTIVSEVIEEQLGFKPELSTTGGTSDARFIKDYAPVAEFGLVGKTMHKSDERIALTDIKSLANIYSAVLKRYFA